MSVCEYLTSGRGHLKLCSGTRQRCTRNPDTCPVAPILKALPAVSEEQREAALRELTRKPNKEVRCKKCKYDRTCSSYCSNGEMFVAREEVTSDE